MLKKILAAGCLVAALAQTVHAQGSNDYDFTNGDPAMAEAISDARATFPLFVDGTMRGGMSAANSWLRINVPFRSGALIGGETLWVQPFSQNADGTWSGVLTVRPQLLDQSAGDTITFTADQISDWAWQSLDGTLYGAYTLRVLASRGATDGQIDTPLSDTAMPRRWR